MWPLSAIYMTHLVGEKWCGNIGQIFLSLKKKMQLIMQRKTLSSSAVFFELIHVPFEHDCFFLWLAGMVWSFMSKETVLLLNPVLSAWLNVNWNPKRHATWHPQIKATGMKLLIVFIQACSDAKARPGFLSDKSLDPAIKAIVKKFPVTDTKVCSFNVLEML